MRAAPWIGKRMGEGLIGDPDFQPFEPVQMTPPRFRKKQPFEPVLDKVRDRPGEWGKVAVYSKGGKAETARKARVLIVKMQGLMRKELPLEDWGFKTRLAEGTWQDREVWACYRGLMTPEEAMEEAEMRQVAWNNRKKLSNNKKADREARMHIRAILEERQDKRKEAVLRQNPPPQEALG